MGTEIFHLRFNNHDRCPFTLTDIDELLSLRKAGKREAIFWKLDFLEIRFSEKGDFLELPENQISKKSYFQKILLFIKKCS